MRGKNNTIDDNCKFQKVEKKNFFVHFQGHLLVGYRFVMQLHLSCYAIFLLWSYTVAGLGHAQILVFGHWIVVSGGIIQTEGDINILFTHSSL
jgi:hypothetical protein